MRCCHTLQWFYHERVSNMGEHRCKRASRIHACYIPRTLTANLYSFSCSLQSGWECNVASDTKCYARGVVKSQQKETPLTEIVHLRGCIAKRYQDPVPSPSFINLLNSTVWYPLFLVNFSFCLLNITFAYMRCCRMLTWFYHGMRAIWGCPAGA